jgi:pilus assembly protein CpaF
MAGFERNAVTALTTTGSGRGQENARKGIGFNEYQELKSQVHRELVTKVDLEKVANVRDGRVRNQVFTIVQYLVDNLSTPMSATEKDRLAREVLDEVFGLGPLEPLLQDATVSDILVNGHKNVFIERAGVIERTEVMFKDDAHLMHIIERIVSAVGRRVDESSPMVDARLADGSRVNVIIPPLAIDGPQLSIRRFGRTPITDNDLVQKGSLTPGMLDLLRGAVRARLNIVISGGTGSGKTTMLNALSGYISVRERIVTIEDSAELQLKQTHVIRLETRPPNVEGKGAVQQRQLLINSLRMRPDRIIMGEVRGEEALDMLQAMNTGHDGSMTTIHANTPQDAIARMETMALMSDLSISEKAIRRQIASAVSIVMQIARFADGSRRVTHISEVTGSTDESVTLSDIFVYQQQGVSTDGRVVGAFTATGFRPKFAAKLKASGIALPPDMFEPAVSV